MYENNVKAKHFEIIHNFHTFSFLKFLIFILRKNSIRFYFQSHTDDR
jgi:hypothetical protein